MKNVYDVIVVGSGIAGMTAAMYLKRGGVNVIVIEETAPGGQLNKIADIENYPGFSKISGPELAMNVYNQVSELDIEIIFEKVIDTKLNGEIKEIVTNSQILYCKNLVIATGRLSKKLMDDDYRYVGKGISYCAICDGNLYKNKDVAVVGGGNSALEEMLYLANICHKVTGVLRGDEFRGDKYLVDQVKKKKNIEIMYNTNIAEYNIENNQLVSVSFDNGNKLDISGLFISIGSAPSASVFDVVKDKGFIVVDDNGMTNINNVYACGDVIKKNVYQLTTAISEGTVVAYKIIRDMKNK